MAERLYEDWRRRLRRALLLSGLALLAVALSRLSASLLPLSWGPLDAILAFQLALIYADPEGWGLWLGLLLGAVKDVLFGLLFGPGLLLALLLDLSGLLFFSRQGSEKHRFRTYLSFTTSGLCLYQLGRSLLFALLPLPASRPALGLLFRQGALRVLREWPFLFIAWLLLYRPLCFCWEGKQGKTALRSGLQ